MSIPAGHSISSHNMWNGEKYGKKGDGAGNYDHKRNNKLSEILWSCRV